MCLVPVASVAAPADLAALTFRMAGDDLRTRIVVMFDREPEVNKYILSDPHRLVIDLPRTGFGFDKDSVVPRGLVGEVRYGLIGDQRSRLILNVNGPFQVDNLTVVKNETAPGYRLMADIVAVSEREFKQALNDQQETRKKMLLSSVSGEGEDKVKRANTMLESKKFTVMIDPGHGGIDSGAESRSGTLEKNVTLAFGKQLQEELSKNPDLNVLMTREDDRFLRLSERVRLARQHEADLFLSLHADTIRHKDVRGATVYTLSDKASDDVARAMAERENNADEAVGIYQEAAPVVSDILMELTQRETHAFSLNFADKLISSLEGEVNLINNPHRFAGFQVLRAPDVPSVLVEVGYLSNHEDEKLLKDPAWRKRVVDRVSNAVNKYYKLISGVQTVNEGDTDNAAIVGATVTGASKQNEN